MNKVSFLVALLAFLQAAATGTQSFGQDRLSDDARRTVEEALDLAGDDIGEELEALVGQLGQSAEQLTKHLERWAEDNSEELEAWSEKHSREWEAWGKRFGQKMERLSADQENVWGKWANQYERNLERWAQDFESSEGMAPDQLGEFVEQNLKSLSKMPLGQLVDKSLKEGLGQLSDAPWDSLDELGALAQDAFEEPLGELTEILDENSGQRRALERSAEHLGRVVEQLKQDVGRNIADSERETRIDSNVDPRVRALKKLRQRDNVSPEQLERIDEMIKTLQDARHVGGDERPAGRPRLDVPQRDQIKAKIEREKQRHEKTLQQFNDDLQRSSEDSRVNGQRKSEMKLRERDSRATKRVDGKNMKGNSTDAAQAKQNNAPRFQRDGRDGKANRKPAVTDRARKEAVANPDKSDLELLREEIARLRKEVQQLKKDSDK